jgi:hypothetical protein
VRAGKHVLAWKRESKRSVGNETDLLDKGATIKVVRAAVRPWLSCLAREPAIKASALSVFPRPISFEPPVSANGSLLLNLTATSMTYVRKEATEAKRRFAMNTSSGDGIQVAWRE